MRRFPSAVRSGRSPEAYNPSILPRLAADLFHRPIRRGDRFRQVGRVGCARATSRPEAVETSPDCSTEALPASGAMAGRDQSFTRGHHQSDPKRRLACKRANDLGSWRSRNRRQGKPSNQRVHGEEDLGVRKPRPARRGNDWTESGRWGEGARHWRAGCSVT